MAKSRFERVRAFIFAGAFGLALMSTAASAETITLDNIPKDKVEEIKKLVETSKPTAEQIAITESNAKVDQYSNLGQSLGKAMKATAAELNMPLDEFNKSNIGQFSYLWLAWELWLGNTANTIANVTIGMLWLAMAFTIWYKLFVRICLTESTKFENFTRKYKDETGREIEENGTSKTITLQDMNDGDVAGYRFLFLLVAILITVPAWIYMS